MTLYVSKMLSILIALNEYQLSAKFSLKAVLSSPIFSDYKGDAVIKPVLGYLVLNIEFTYM